MEHQMTNRSGKLVVIDGTSDGSGKGTQTNLLVARLQKSGRRVELTDFPQYAEPSSYFVRAYLREKKYGSPEEVGPYRASVFYALDRYDRSFAMHKWLDEGVMLVSNRYVSSNMGHQAGKIADPDEREAFLDWLEDFEYQKMGIPVPDATVLLHVPLKTAQMLARVRAAATGVPLDLHESDGKHLEDAANAYLAVARNKGWKIVECTSDVPDTLRTEEDIHEEIWVHLLEQGVI